MTERAQTIALPPRETLGLSLFGRPRKPPQRRRSLLRDLEKAQLRRLQGRIRQADYARRCAASGRPTASIVARALLAALVRNSPQNMPQHRVLIEETLAVLAEHGYRPEPSIERLRKIWDREHRQTSKRG